MKTRTALAFIIAISYAIFLSSLPVMDFKDRDSYVNNYIIPSSEVWTEATNNGIVNLLVSEPIFKLLNHVLYPQLSPEIILRLYIFFPAFVTAFIILRQPVPGFVFLVFMLFFPYVINKHIHHLRHSIAIMILVFAWFHSSKNLKRILVSILPLIHIGMIIPSIFFFLKDIIRRKFSNDYLIILMAFVFGLFLTVITQTNIVSESISKVARYSGADSDLSSGIGGAWIIWSITLVVMVSNGKKFVEQNLIPLSMIAFYLGAVIGFSYSLRFLEQVIWLVFIAGMQSKPKQRYLFMALMLVIFSYHWYSKADLPQFGY